jgi:hypothetical protein
VYQGKRAGKDIAIKKFSAEKSAAQLQKIFHHEIQQLEYLTL